MKWQSFRVYMREVASSLVPEAAAREVECLKRADDYKMPLDGPRLRRAAKAVADAADAAAAAEGGGKKTRRARPLLGAAKAAAKASRYGSGKQSADVLCGLAMRVQKAAIRLKGATAGMQTDPTAARALAEQAWSFAETMRVIAEARAKADDATRLREQAEKRARLMLDCGRYIEIAKCDACGEFIEGTGELVSLHCHARACPVCARFKSCEDFHELLDAMKAVEQRAGYEWRMIELTFQRSPLDWRQHTIDALAERLDALFRVVEHVWGSYMIRHEGAALYAKVENAGTGHVHAHLLYYGPVIPSPEFFGAIVRQVTDLPRGIKHGFTWMENAKKDMEALAAEATKYVTKSHSPMSEDWLAGDEREVMHPVLAARWELATMGKKLSRTYGALRADKQPKQERDDAAPQDAQQEQPEEPRCPEFCPYCGTMGEVFIVRAETESTVLELHAKGMPALRGSRWTPKPKLMASPLLVEKQREHGGDVVVLYLRDHRVPWEEPVHTVVSRADVLNGFFADVPRVVRPDDLAPLDKPAADGATWLLSVEVKKRVRARLEQVVFAAAA